MEGPLTRLVIMDSDGGDKARALARALVDIGQPLAYVMEVGGGGVRVGMAVVEPEREQWIGWAVCVWGRRREGGGG